MRMTLLLSMAASGALLLAQTPARDAPARITTGTASIAGAVVTNDAEGRPVRMATVTLSGSALVKDELVTTDESGRFAFGDLPAGRYTVEVSKPGFVPTQFGATRPTSSGIPIVVAAGERGIANVRLQHGAAISGTIAGPDGESASGVVVLLMQYVTRPGRERTLSGAEGVGTWRWQRTTDDRGMYRFYGLAAGQYYVAAVPVEPGARQVTSAEFDWARLSSQGAGANSAAAPARGPSVSLAPVLFPGVADPAGATAVTVGSGEERDGIDFPLQYVPTATISGVVLDADGQPPQVAQVNLLQPSGSIFLRSSFTFRSNLSGGFSVSGVTPGQYVLAARGSAHAPPGAAAGGTGSNVLSLWALMEVLVDGRDIPNLEVRLQPGATVSGRLVFDGTSAKPPADLTKVRVSLSPVQVGQAVNVGALDGQVLASGTFGPPGEQMLARGTFTVPGVAPGRYRISASVPAVAPGAASWTLRSAVVGGADSLDVPFDVRPGESIADAVVTFTDRPTEITGTIVDAAGKPAPQFVVIIFSTDRSFWTPQSRRVRSVRPGDNGTYRIAGLPPGQYYMYALTDLDSNLLYTVSYLEPLVGASFTIALAEGEKRVQDLKVR